MWSVGVLLLLFQTRILSFELCPEDWEYVHSTHSCYFRSKTTLSWEDAKEDCEKKEFSHLATILNQEEMDAVVWVIDEFLTWIGLRLDPQPLWVDGTPVNFSKYLKTTNGLQEGPCIAWQVNKEQNGWKPIACEYSQFYLCKSPAFGDRPEIHKGNYGRIYSPNYPLGYPPDIYWQYLIETEEGTRIELTFDHIDLEYGRDMLEVLDIGNIAPISLLRYSGKIYDKAVISKTNRITVILKTDENVSHPGFHAQWKAREPESSVIQNYTEPEGEIRSHPWPGPIERFNTYRYYIICPAENHVVLTIKECVLSSRDSLDFYIDPKWSTEWQIFKIRYNGTVSETQMKSIENTIFVQYNGVDGESWSQRYRFEYYCQRNDGLGEEVIIP